MADVPVTIYKSRKVRPGFGPTTPDYPADEDPIVVNPPGSGLTTEYKRLGDVDDRSFIGKEGWTPIVVGEDKLQLIPLPQFDEYRLISGGVVQWTGSGYVFNVSSAIYKIGGVLYQTIPDQVTLATPDATNNRLDVIAVDVNSQVVVITGTPSATPVKPQIDPSTQLELTTILVTASTTDPVLTEEVIYDENTEWTGSNSGTGTVSFSSTADPYQGTVSIDTTNIQNGLKIRLTNSIDFDISTVQTFGFQIKLKAALFAAQNIGLTFLDSGGSPVSNQLIVSLNKSDLDYQFVGIALNSLILTSTSIRLVEFQYIRTKGATVHAGFFLDIVKFEGGINPPVTIGSFLGLSDTPSSYSGQGAKVVAVKSDESGLEFITGGGGGVQSVTGDGVDNTDPDNPVISYPDPSDIGAEEAFTKGDLIAGTNVTLSGPLTGRLVGAGNVTINASGGGGGSGLTDMTGFPVIPFDGNYRHSHEMFEPVEISVNTTLARTFPNYSVIYIKADGTNKPTFKDSDNFSVVYDGWNNTAGEWNRLRIEWSPQGVPVVQIMATSGATSPGTGATDFALLFDADYSFSHVITGTVSLSVDDTGADFTKKTIFYFQADGTNKPTWSSEIECNFDNYVNEAGVWNRFYLEWTPENKVTLQIQNT